MLVAITATAASKQTEREKERVEKADSVHAASIAKRRGAGKQSTSGKAKKQGMKRNSLHPLLSIAARESAGIVGLQVAHRHPATKC